MILIALGANLPHPVHGMPRRTMDVALTALAAHGVEVIARSRLYRTAPVGPGRQRPYWNAVVAVETILSPQALLGALHTVEAQLGRRRRRRWAARLIDLDLIAYHDLRCAWAARRYARGLVLPHPRLHRRAFVLAPLLDIAPSWRHPATRRPAKRLLARLPAAQAIRARMAWRPARTPFL
ncbi:MAG: 2-amino-4-hydroxy-6-hydroxymethyldihydropteridine diphosphokinase [Alphaproteobacteria bacterium]|nr:MAG: 2-amino-4-hydroxy-6-hydroxymethyldihydropteridine diphosphokinase [Alphaproteobacteria bacterium]